MQYTATTQQCVEQQPDGCDTLSAAMPNWKKDTLMGPPDSLLEYLVAVFSTHNGEGDGESCEVTVQVNGMLISGRLVSVLDFYRAYRDHGMPPRREMWEQLIDRETRDNEEIAVLREAVQETIGNDTAHLSARESDLLKRLRIDYLHLENALLQTPGSAPMMLPVWRVRLADVSGWMVGYLRDFTPMPSTHVSRNERDTSDALHTADA